VQIAELESKHIETADLAGGFLASTSRAMRALELVVAEIARTDIPVLLVGESGTGKEVLALRIHQLSLRRGEPFQKVNCAALTPDFFQLNGAGRQGKENGSNGAASRGTIFLDEISELDAACQSKLVCVIPDGAAVHAEGPAMTGRLICATRRNLEDELRAGRFREELYFRINGVCLRLPPLRQRREDIPALADYFLRRYAAEFSRQVPALSAEAAARLASYSWPGNIRELENVCKKIVALGDEQLALADLAGNGNGHDAAGRGANGSGEISLKEASRAASRLAERELILKTLARTRWNRRRAAQELHISYKALLYKLKQIGVEDGTES
jgi:two-component system response regulator AtoC